MVAIIGGEPRRFRPTFTEIGKERGWPPTTRAQFDATRGPTGALLIGDAETVAEKVLYVNKVLGGISRITFQMGASSLPKPKMRAIEILGTKLAPRVRKELASVLNCKFVEYVWRLKPLDG
jgi:hypothetical protein